MTAPTLTALSLGAGVQSTTLALLAIEGVLPKPDCAIFGDTGWEPTNVYAHLDRLEIALTLAGIPLYRVSNGNLRADAIDPAHRYASVPYFVRNPDGTDGMGRRQCTSEYKLVPIRRKVRELLGAAPPKYRTVPRGQVCEQWVGFSTDETQRVNDLRDGGGVRYLTTRYPLLIRWLEARGWATEKSACIGCPYHGNRQCGLPLDGTAYLHRSRVPLDQAPIDRVTRSEWNDRQVNLLDLIADDAADRAAYDPDEDGDPDGCSPYGCRSGAPVDGAA
jgi:hypothetical protein